MSLNLSARTPRVERLLAFGEGVDPRRSGRLLRSDTAIARRWRGGAADRDRVGSPAYGHQSSIAFVRSSNFIVAKFENVSDTA